MLEIGNTYMWHTMPGWLLAGRYAGPVEGRPDWGVFDGGIYIVAVKKTAHDAAAAKTAAQLRSAITSHRTIPDGMMVNLGFVTHFVPCARDMSPLHGADDANAISEAAGG